MKINRPLINPSPKDFEEKKRKKEELDYVQELKVGKDQMRMDIDDRRSKFQQIFNTFKSKLNRRREVMEVSPFWKSFAVPALVTFFIVNTLSLLFILIFHYTDLPPKIRFFYNSVEKSWVQIDKPALILVPIIYFMVFSIQLKFIIQIFRKDRRLALTIIWVSAFISMLFFISILSLIKTYSVI